MESADRLEKTSGLFPQKMLEGLLHHEVVRSARYPSPISLLYLALCYPDNASAAVIESAQLVFANLLHSKLRESDLPGHYKGNYLVILPATDSAGARVAGERLLTAFKSSQVTRTAERYEISVNVGICSHPGGEGISVSDLAEGASAALSEARRRGPKSLVVHGEMRTGAE